MPFILIPYVLQLLCIVHIIKTRRNTYWIWIIVILPYVGGLAYVLIEILPTIASRGNTASIRNTVSNFLNPNQGFEVLRQRAKYSPTHKNIIEYADALMERKEYDKALATYTEQNAGAFLDDPELLYRIANAHFNRGDYDETLRVLSVLKGKSSSYDKYSRENLLYLLTIEKTRDFQYVKTEYQRIMNTIRNNSIEIPYLDFLLRNDDFEEMKAVIERIQDDERAMIVNNSRYDRKFYREASKYKKRMQQFETPHKGE